MRCSSFRCTAYNNEFRKWSDSGVQATITDKRRSVCNEELGIAYFEAEVLTQSDYYPFGMMMPDRQWSAGAEGYRYGFNGMERDDEVKGMGNFIEYKYRIHDPRLGRFLSVDPLGAEYSWNSPYAFAENDVIRCIDLEGMEKWISTQNEIVYGPINPDYGVMVKYKPLIEVVQNTRIMLEFENLFTDSKTFRDLVKKADVYQSVAIMSSAVGTFTTSSSRAYGERTTSMQIYIQEGTTEAGIQERIAFEITNAVNYLNGKRDQLVDNAIRGDITREEFIKESCLIEAEASVNAALIDYEMGGNIIKSEEMYNQISQKKDTVIKNIAKKDFESGTRETTTGTRTAKEVYGEQYDKYRSTDK